MLSTPSTPSTPSTSTSPAVVASPTTEPVVELRNITVEFPGVLALDDVSFRLFPGEVHALLGENGAGKSTLIKTLTGVYHPVAGQILVSGAPVHVSGPADSQAAGISTVYQEITMAGNLSVAENIMLGREPRRFGGINFAKMRKQAAEVLKTLNLDIDPGSLLESHSIAVQQLVAIARAMGVDAKVLVLDEPTSSLDAREVEELFALVRQVRASGVAVLFVTHFLDQVYAISDRITVLRNGRFVCEELCADLPRVELVSRMIGRELENLENLSRRTAREVPAVESEPTETAPIGADPTAPSPVISAEHLGRKGGVEAFDLELREGEVVGLAGLLGSGRTEVARLLYGADRPDSGRTLVNGEELKIRGPHIALGKGICMASENRRTEGLIGDLSVRANIVLAMQSEKGWARAIPRRLQAELADKYIKALDIRPPNPDMLVGNLSGGNQQKVLLARWLLTAPKVLMLDEPTRGIDVGAKAEIQKLVTNLAEDGMSVLFISAELEEVVRLSHRIVVMRDRSKVAEVVNDDVTVSDLMHIIAQGSEAS